MKLKKDNKIQLEEIIKDLDSSFFFYDLDALQLHLESMMKNKMNALKLWYACKANPLSYILNILNNLHFGIDVASLGELKQSLSSEVSPKNILATGPAKSKKYLRSLLEEKVRIIVLESLNQAYWLNEVAAEMHVTPTVLLRVQLEWDEGKSILGGNEITPFGINTKEWELLELSRCNNLNFQGLHVFQWG